MPGLIAVVINARVEILPTEVLAQQEMEIFKKLIMFDKREAEHFEIQRQQLIMKSLRRAIDNPAIRKKCS